MPLRGFLADSAALLASGLVDDGDALLDTLLLVSVGDLLAGTDFLPANFGNLPASFGESSFLLLLLLLMLLLVSFPSPGEDSSSSSPSFSSSSSTAVAEFD